ncbi:hypothetical protein AB833_16570 [Chromatiales bacterium (ex Bugula neritina AB1)]|nr:hypothetical protein AB833_16570 [Chromatiales bacterium (ex Bugula neritina AB1)]
MQSIIVCALYKFVRLENYLQIRDPLLELMLELRVRGTLLLAREGINGTIAGERAGIDSLLKWLRAQPGLEDLDCKESITSESPFKRSRVKIKKEIVTMGVEGLDPVQSAGTYVAPKDWNALISDPDVLLIDTRNDYECEVGSFEGAVNPHTASFRDFPAYVEKSLQGKVSKTTKVAMFCTGGIRCEKSTAYLRSNGFSEVYHLQGGILKYLEEVPLEDSMWEGECFVFDERVTVNHQLEKGSYDQCHACRRPITETDKNSELYNRGVSCPHCYHTTSEEDKARFLQREKQMKLARVRGEAHMGEEAREELMLKRQSRLEPGS